MTISRDLSAKGSKYFIDDRTYNCPFCNRRNVPYKVKTSSYCFHWDNSWTVHLYLVQCSERECDRMSFHLSKHKLRTTQRDGFECPPKTTAHKPKGTPDGAQIEVIVPILNEEKQPKELDDCFFFHQPSSFFTVDDRIPVTTRTTEQAGGSGLKGKAHVLWQPKVSFKPGGCRLETDGI